MSLRTKLLTALLLLIISPISIVGITTFFNARSGLEERILDQLESIANVQEARINEVVVRLLDQANLIASRTQLRTELAAYNKNDDVIHSTKIGSLITDALRATTGAQSITILGLDGTVAASTDTTMVGETHSNADFFRAGLISPQLYDVVRGEDGLLHIHLVAPFILNGEVIGVLSFFISADPFIAITEDYTGLGKTGEVILARPNDVGDAIFLTPLRFDAGAALTRAVPSDREDIPIIPAVNGIERIFIDGAVDYRGEPIIAVNRFIDSLGWGLVVKIDAEEAFAPIRRLALFFISVSLITLGASVAVSIFFAHGITKSIFLLTLFAQNLQSGNFSMRTEVRSRDELGFLARTLNTMAERLQDIYRNLEEKVRERTAQLEQTNAKDEAILASIGDGLVVTDTDGTIILINKAFENMLGWKESEVLGENITEIVVSEDEKENKIAREKRTIFRVLATQEKMVTDLLGAHYYVRKDKSRFPVSASVTPILVDGKLIGAIEVFRDITLEHDIDTAKTEFVSLASHQLRTPLATIRWYVEMLLSGDAGALSEEQEEFLKEIATGNSRMTDLVDALLNVSRIELGTFSVEPEMVDIRAIATQTIKDVQPLMQEKKLALTLDDTHAPHQYNGDPRLLSIIFQNLISNAVKYTQEGSVVVTIGTKKKYLTIAVADTGYGIPEKQKNRIFTKLFRADNVKEHDTTGTGLGLYIIKAIVEQSGGRVWFESTQGKGSTFYVELPLAGMKSKSGSRPLET